LIGRPFGVYGTSVAFYDAFHDGEADADPFEFPLSVQTLESFEQLVAVFRVETGSMIPDIIRAGALRRHGSDFDGLDRGFSRVFDGIGEQVFQHLPDERAIAPCGRKFADTQGVLIPRTPFQ